MTEVDTLVSVVACREALTAAMQAAAGDRGSAVAGLIGALIVIASTAPEPTETLAGMIESLEASRLLLATVRARIIAAAGGVTPPGGQPS